MSDLFLEDSFICILANIHKNKYKYFVIFNFK